MATTQILIIDDDAGQHLILEHQLQLSGYGVLHAYSGQEAVDMVASQAVDLIILDVNMPGMDGFQTLATLRSGLGREDIPVIFLSSLNRQYLKVKGLEGGADDYLTKPFDSAELTARIKAVLRRTRPPTTLPPGTMQGQIAAMGLAELLQSMSLSAKTCTIIFPEMAGEIAIIKGAVSRIRQGGFRGKNALVRLLLRQHGTFTVHYDVADEAGAEEQSSIEHLLLYGVSQADEFKEKCQELGPADMMLTLAGPTDEYPAIAELAATFPITIFDLLLTINGELPANLEMVRAALAQGVINYQAAPENGSAQNPLQE